MAEETISPTLTEAQPATKDPVFLLMVSGQLESAEVWYMNKCISGIC